MRRAYFPMVEIESSTLSLERPPAALTTELLLPSLKTKIRPQILFDRESRTVLNQLSWHNHTLFVVFNGEDFY